MGQCGPEVCPALQTPRPCLPSLLERCYFCFTDVTHRLACCNLVAMIGREEQEIIVWKGKSPPDSCGPRVLILF